MGNIVVLRDHLAEAIEHAIAVLDALDGDADLEPSGDEHEPCLGSLGGTITAAPMSQSRWAFACGAYDDTEEEDDGREPDANAEECNGDRRDLARATQGQEDSMSTSWRDILPVHPAADLFPMMTPDEITALGEDIKNNGLKQPIVLIKTPDGDALLDGRNRLDAMASVGLTTDLALIEHRVLDADADPFAFVISANIYRRHLTADQRRDLIAKVLKATPDASNRQIAAQVKADDKTVAKVRKVLEATADIPQLKKTTGKDGKARTTTPKKPAPPPPAAPAPEPASAPEDDFPEMPAFLLRGKLAEPKPDDPRTNIDLDRLRSEAEELQKIVQNAISSEYDDAYSSAAEYVVTSLKGYDADVFLPLILAALGVAGRSLAKPNARRHQADDQGPRPRGEASPPHCGLG